MTQNNTALFDDVIIILTKYMPQKC